MFILLQNRVNVQVRETGDREQVFVDFLFPICVFVCVCDCAKMRGRGGERDQGHAAYHTRISCCFPSYRYKGGFHTQKIRRKQTKF